ncbi:hypothetical protein CYY_006589 [Polysphondylium violaceum]|uniref:Uncharacterized protein n=1 Tax=Polysphondylium violaceum TaxID=133409 RepID=A0A8J4UY52_9MYCE|nr:hypothetical protein CYY_006589 [Polysphondylium violaceum]
MDDFMKLPDRSFIDEIDFQLEDPLKIIDGFIPNGVETLSMGYDFNQPITKSLIPASVKKLNLEKSFNFSGLHTDSFLHTSLEELYLHSTSRPIDPLTLPPSLKRLTIKNYNHTLTKQVMPMGLKYLHIQDISDLEPNSLPSSLLEIKTNSPKILDHLPNKLIWFYYFGREMDRLEAPKLTKLSFTTVNPTTTFFHSLSTNLVELSCSMGNHKPFDLVPGLLPLSLKKLTLNHYYGDIYKDSIPSNVEYCNLYFDSNQTKLKCLSLPQSIKVLIINFSLIKEYPVSPLSIVPSSVTDLTLISVAKDVLKKNVPLSVVKLELSYCMLPNSMSFPKCLESLTYFNPSKPIEIKSNHLPKSLTNLKLSSPTIKVDKNLLPPLVQLKKLFLPPMKLSPKLAPHSLSKLTVNILNSLPGPLAEGIVELTIISHLNEPVELTNTIPKSVRKLKLQMVNVHLSAGDLPEQLQSLDFCNCLYQNVLDYLPKSLVHLSNLPMIRSNPLFSLPSSLETLQMTKSSYDYNFIQKGNVIPLHLKLIKITL